MDFTQAIAVFIARERTSSMVDTLMVVALSLQTGIDAVLVCIKQCAWMPGVFAERLDRLLLHMGEQMDHHVTPTLSHPKDGRFFRLQRATATCAFPSASTPVSALALDDVGWPFMAGCHIGLIALHLVGERHRGLFFTIPSRRCAVMCCTSLPLSANSWPICSFDKLSPMKYRHKTQTFSG